MDAIVPSSTDASSSSSESEAESDGGKGNDKSLKVSENLSPSEDEKS